MSTEKRVVSSAIQLKSVKQYLQNDPDQSVVEALFEVLDGLTGYRWIDSAKAAQDRYHAKDCVKDAFISEKIDRATMNAAIARIDGKVEDPKTVCLSAGVAWREKK